MSSLASCQVLTIRLHFSEKSEKMTAFFCRFVLLYNICSMFYACVRRAGCNGFIILILIHQKIVNGIST